ncbi:MAG: hypothetical protein RL094_711 [Candidatus Parcubacteria bacterium]|jgi:hypothetical protein
MTQKEALEILKSGRNVFVTGPAGSGKTHLINTYIEFLKAHNIDVGITASTGIAATHMGGVTIHSWAGIGINNFLTEYDLEAMAEKSYLSSRFDKVKVLIIDEVSMLHHFRFDLINKVMKAMKGNNDPFGGVQVVLCGDFFQLPPVSRFGEPKGEFIYKSESWREADFTICYLEEQFRQKDLVMNTILNEIRSGEVSKEAQNHLKSRENVRTYKEVEPTKLFTHNIDVDALNFTELEKLKSSEVADHTMQTKGKENLALSLKKSCLAPEQLRLKVGARVMCVKNNFEVGYVNGTLGVVVSCKPNQDPRIRVASGEIITIERASWKIEEEGKTKAEILQYPLRLAWAITVHKSQGMSLDAVEVDLSKSFEPGMGYVALSRVRSLEGLTILGINNNALEVNEEVLEFDDMLRARSAEARSLFEKMSPETLEAQQKEFLDYAKPKKREEKLTTYQETALLIDQELSLGDIALMRGLSQETIVSHIEKLIADDPSFDISYLKKEISKPHFAKIKAAIEELAESLEDDEAEIRLSPIKNKVGSNISYLHIQLARAILGYAPKGKLAS